MAAAGSCNSGQSPKVPKHFWWTKRIFLAWLLLVAALFVSRFVWGWEADKRLERVRAAIAARGETLDRFQADIPPEQNAAWFYNHAYEAAKVADWQRVYFLVHALKLPAMRGEHDAEILALLAANQEVFTKCHAARSLQRVDWYPRTPPVFWGSSYAAWLHWLLMLQGAWQTEQGDSAGAIETLLDAEALARAVDEDSGTAARSWVYCLELESVYRMVEWVTPRLTIAGPAVPDTARPADPRAVRKLVQVLLEGHALDCCRKSLLLDRAVTNTVIDQCSATSRMHGYFWWPSWLPTICDWPLVPMIRCDGACCLEQYGHWVDAVQQPSMLLALRLMPPEPTLPTDSLKGFASVMSANLGFSINAVPTAYGTEASSRLAATLLALRLYELEKGHPAHSLADLVPEYLPAVPADPFDPAGGSIRALLADPHPRVYSLGYNRTDDGANSKYIDDVEKHLYLPLDVVYYLRRADMPMPMMIQYPPEWTRPAPQWQLPTGIWEFPGQSDEERP